MPGWPKSWKICCGPGARKSGRDRDIEMANCFGTACDHDMNWMWERSGLRLLKMEPSILMAAKALLKHKTQGTIRNTEQRKASNCLDMGLVSHAQQVPEWEQNKKRQCHPESQGKDRANQKQMCRTVRTLPFCFYFRNLWKQFVSQYQHNTNIIWT